MPVDDERIPSSADGADELANRLHAEGTSMFMLSFVDNAGIARVKTLPVRRLPAAARYGVGVSPCFETFTFDDVMAVGRFVGGPDGDLRLVPDLSRLTRLTRLATSPLEAAERLAAAPVLAAAMGEQLHDALLTVRRAEGERFAQATPAELVELTRWRF